MFAGRFRSCFSIFEGGNYNQPIILYIWAVLLMLRVLFEGIGISPWYFRKNFPKIEILQSTLGFISPERALMSYELRPVFIVELYIFNILRHLNKINICQFHSYFDTSDYLTNTLICIYIYIKIGYISWAIVEY
jgi:hypothetical protein